MNMFSNLSFGEILVVLGCMLISLTLHEAMHAFSAHVLGDTTAQEEGRLSLNPLKHLDLLTTIILPVVLMLVHLPPFFIAKPVPFDPRNVRHGDYGAAMVALAGPFTNLALAVLGSLVLRAVGVGAGYNLVQILVVFIEVNILFFVFNMIPFPPLDGSRLLYAFAPDGLRALMRQVESAGFLMIILFMLVVFPFLSPTISGISQAIFNLLLR
jgi:Zn-dependent protease